MIVNYPAHNSIKFNTLEISKQIFNSAPIKVNGKVSLPSTVPGTGHCITQSCFH